ncbi:HNH endonuclease [Georgenia yuyongxinii]|uniref:HNH endonuclease n=1 Tax=Georgenia yuyongxinii TaxID=2589797 RepID=UPI00163DBE86|nr:HNH endonuclease signature motif containing protein [Georgenia yuyongxinii]
MLEVDGSPSSVPPLVPPAELLGGVRTAVARLVEGAPASGAGWQHAERESVIAGLDAVVQSLTVYRGRLLVAHKEDGRWGTALDRDFADWRGRASGTGRGPAVGELQVAEGLQAMPEVADAVAGGELTLEHARALTRLRATGSAEVKAALEAGAAADLVARGKSLSAPELAREAKKVAAAIDAQAAQDSFAAVWRRRAVSTRRGAGGRVGEWFLDDVGGTIVETALDAIVGKPAVDDDRTREQRRADALVTMAARVLRVGADRVGAQIRPHLALIVEEQTWAALLARRAAIEAADRDAVDAAAGFTGAAFGLGADGLPRATATLDTASATATGETFDTTAAGTLDTTSGRAGGRRAGCVPPRRVVLPGLPPLPNVPAAELEDGSLVPGGELDRIMCDCEVTRIVMDARSMPLDVGQTQRLYNRELRRAVTTRDRHCQWPGCSIRAAWCEVHHVWFWANGGPTALCNGCTLCIYHHHRVHQEHIRITILADGFEFHHRDGRLLGTTQRPPRPSGARRATTTTAGVEDGLTPARTTCHDPLIESWPPALDQPPRAVASTGPIASEARGTRGTATATSATASSTAGADGTGTPRPGAPPGNQLSAPPRGRPGAPPGGRPGTPSGSQRGAPPRKSAGAQPQPSLWDDGIPAGQASGPPF